MYRVSQPSAPGRRTRCTTSLESLNHSAPSPSTDQRWVRTHRGVDAAVAEVTGWNNVTEHLNENFLADAVGAILSKHPNVQFAFYSRTEDTTQLTFYALMGGIPAGTAPADAIKRWNRHNLAMLEGLQARHANFRSFVAPGKGHCGMTFDSALKEAGFKTWLEDILLHPPSNTSAAAANSTGGGAASSQAASRHPNCGAPCTLAGIQGCDGAVGSNKIEDRCGQCGGDGSSCPALQHTVASGQCPPVPSGRMDPAAASGDGYLSNGASLARGVCGGVWGTSSLVLSLLAASVLIAGAGQ